MDLSRGGFGVSQRAACACLFSLFAFQSIAKERQPFPKVDPYTRGEPAALTRAGYASLGPFSWGDDHTTRQIEEALGGIPVIWVETAHFKLGSTLPEYRIVADSDERDKLRAELTRLGERLPHVDKSTKRLDPWLRLHMYAARLEELYARFCAKLGLTELDFVASDDADHPPSLHLGLNGKFSVLLVQEASALDRYCRTFLGRAESNAISHWFPRANARFLGMSVEGYREIAALDTAFHFGLVYQVVLEFETSFRGTTQPGPPWWRHGLARWFAREVDPRILLFATPGGATLRPESDSHWRVKVSARVENGEFPSTADMLDWKDASGWSFVDHMIAWSRVDYLLQRDDGAARRLFMALHDPVPWTASREQRLVALHQGVLEAATGLSPSAFDESWCRYVTQTYERR